MIIYFFINIMVSDFGEVAERLKAAVLKTVARLVRALSSNLSLSVFCEAKNGEVSPSKLFYNLERRTLRQPHQNCL